MSSDCSSEDDNGAGLTGGRVGNAAGNPISLDRLQQYHAEITRLLSNSQMQTKNWIRKTRKVIKAMARHRDLRYNVANYANIFPGGSGTNGDFGARVVTFHMALLGPWDPNTNEYGSWRTLYHGHITDGGKSEVAGYQNNQKVTSDLEIPTGRAKHEDTISRFVGPRYSGYTNNGVTIRPDIKAVPSPTDLGNQGFTGYAAYGIHGNFN